MRLNIYYARFYCILRNKLNKGYLCGMAILHRKEEKIQVVMGRLPENHTDEEFVKMFIKLYSKDWGKIKSAYIKQSQDREPGTIITMPKPELYLKQLAEIYLKANPPKAKAVKEKTVATAAPAEKVKKVAVKKVTVTETPVAEPKVKKVAAKKKAEVTEAPAEVIEKVKVTRKKKEEPAEKPAPKKKVAAKK